MEKEIQKEIPHTPHTLHTHHTQVTHATSTENHQVAPELGPHTPTQVTLAGVVRHRHTGLRNLPNRPTQAYTSNMRDLLVYSCFTLKLPQTATNCHKT